MNEDYFEFMLDTLSSDIRVIHDMIDILNSNVTHLKMDYNRLVKFFEELEEGVE